MEKQNEKGGSTGSGRGKGSSNSEGPGKMNAGSSAGTGASASSGRGATGMSGSSGTSGRGSDSGTTGSSGYSGRGSDSSTTGSSGSSGRGSDTGMSGSSGTSGRGSGSGTTSSSGTGSGTGTTGSNYGDNSASSTSAKSKAGRGNSQEGDGILSDIGINKNQVLTALGVVAGGALLYKGAKALVSGKDPSLDKKAIIDISTNLTVKRPKEELYAYWRNFENLPNFMSHIEDVRELSDKKSEWTAKIPGGIGTIEWDAEVIWEQKDHSIAWRSLPDSDIENSGEVRFQDAGNGKSTIVETRISYRPPAGKAGAMTAKLLNPAFKKVVENDLKEFKNLMEQGGDRKRSASRM